MLFAYVDDAVADQLEAAGLLFYRMGRGTIRLVTSWQTTADEIEQALAAFESALA
jgi:threonine aldolase